MKQLLGSLKVKAFCLKLSAPPLSTQPAHISRAQSIKMTNETEVSLMWQYPIRLSMRSNPRRGGAVSVDGAEFIFHI